MVDRLSGRYGHRGAWLVLLGGVWLLFGVGVLLDPPAARPWVLYEYLPALVQAAGWWVTGGLAIWQGTRAAATRGYPDTLGHVALYLMPAIRLVCFTLAFLLWVTTRVLVHVGAMDTPIGLQQGWYAAAVWGFIAVMLHHAASWPEPRRPIPCPPAGVDGAL